MDQQRDDGSGSLEANQWSKPEQEKLVRGGQKVMVRSENPEVDSVPSPVSTGESKWFLILLAVAAGGLGGLYAFTRISEEVGANAPAGAPVIVVEATTHKVTPEMARASDEKTGVVAPAFREAATDGNMYSLEEAGGSQQALVLVFIKDGCPCSESAQPFYNQLARLYGQESRFLGVINGDLEVAARWGKANKVAFPIMADSEQTIIRDYQAFNSAYVALVQDGQIRRLWPGYSTGMLREAGAMLAELTGRPEGPLDLLDAPAEPYSGCPYEVDWEAVEADRQSSPAHEAVLQNGDDD